MDYRNGRPLSPAGVPDRFVSAAPRLTKSESKGTSNVLIVWLLFKANIQVSRQG
jgi:hypothetical protein